MLKVNDWVKVIGTTACGEASNSECIPIGKICKIAEINNLYDEPMFLVNGKKYGMFWYFERDLEKGKLVWVKE